MIPPSGRAAKPTPRVANDASVPAIGLAPGKNAWPKYSAAAVPNPMKSYVSITAPTPEPIATFLASLVPCTGPRMERATSLMS